jgi:oxygen-dependent protoporphyrinogen oxidase
MNFDSIIIGAGISGLVAAHRLRSLGRNVLVVESSDRIGGVIQTVEAEEFLVERGPNSLRGTHEFLDLVEELGLADEMVAADPRAPAYVYAGGRLHAVPMSPVALVRTGLISSSAKLRLLREPFIGARVEGGEESIASFVRRRLGDEVLDRLVAPFISGVYAGDPELLSIQACFPKLADFEAESGSVLRGALGAILSSRKKKETSRRSLRPYRLCSFRRGMKALPQALAGSLGDRLITRSRAVAAYRSESGFTIRIERQNTVETFDCSTLVIAAPADVAAALTRDIAPGLAEEIAGISYVSLASVPLAYRVDNTDRSPDGFGFLAPRGEGLRTLGSIWNSSLFPGRAEDGWIVTTNFIGGATDAEAAALGDEELYRIVHDDLRKVLGFDAEPRRLSITRYQRAIPQYSIGHRARVEAIEAALRGCDGLWLAGNYLRGVSLGDCISGAEKIARELNRKIGSGEQ